MQEHYLIEHLKKYVKFEVEQGYHVKDIRQALLNYGYKKYLIDNIFAGLPNLKMPNAKSPPKQEMTEDMHVYIQSMLIDYIKKQQKSGYSLQAIRNALLRSGHRDVMINNALKLIKDDKVSDYSMPIKSVFPPIMTFLFSLFILCVLVLFIGISTDENLLMVMLTMAPAVFGIAITYFVIASSKNLIFFRIMPLISAGISVLIFVVLLNYTYIYNGTQMNVLMVLNVISSFLLSGLMCVLAPKP